jgi:hypothetical protein
MPDDLDPTLLRSFAAAHEPLPDAHFSAQVLARINNAPGGLLAPGSVTAILGAVLSGLRTGVRAALSVRHALIALAAAALTLCALALSP